MVQKTFIYSSAPQIPPGCNSSVQLTHSTKMSLPKTYKHALFKEAGAPLTIEDVTLSLPGKGEVLVKVDACGVCFSDTFAQQNIMGGGL